MEISSLDKKALSCSCRLWVSRQQPPCHSMMAFTARLIHRSNPPQKIQIYIEFLPWITLQLSRFWLCNVMKILILPLQFHIFCGVECVYCKIFSNLPQLQKHMHIDCCLKLCALLTETNYYRTLRAQKRKDIKAM